MTFRHKKCPFLNKDGEMTQRLLICTSSKYLTKSRDITILFKIHCISLYHILESLPLLSGFVLDQGIGTCRLSVFGSNPACDIFFFFNFLKNLKNGILRSNLRKYCYSVFVICTIFCFNGIHNFIVRVMKITCKGSPATSHLESSQLFSQLNSVYSQIFWV